MKRGSLILIKNFGIALFTSLQVFKEPRPETFSEQASGKCGKEKLLEQNQAQRGRHWAKKVSSTVVFIHNI